MFNALQIQADGGTGRYDDFVAGIFIRLILLFFEVSNDAELELTIKNELKGSHRVYEGTF